MLRHLRQRKNMPVTRQTDPGLILGGIPQSLNSPLLPKIFGRNCIFFTIYYLLFIVFLFTIYIYSFLFYSMQCAHVIEWRHEVRVLVDFNF